MALNFAFTADNRNFMSALSQICSGVRDASAQIEREGNNIDRVLSLLKGGVATLGIGLGFKEAIEQIGSTRSEYQKLEIAMKTFLGSAEKADALMKQLIRTAAITPFGMEDVANGAKSLLAYGVAAEDVNATLVKLGDLAAGLSVPLNDIMYLYGTTIAKPKMDTQDLMQFMGRGIPLAKALAEQFGVAENKVRSLVAAGKVGRQEVINAIDSLTGEGSMFGGLMEAQSSSIGGRISNIEDEVEQMFNEMGKQMEGAFGTALDITSSIVEHWREVLLIVGDIAAAYGVQKAMLALDAGFTRAATNYGYDVEIEQLTALLPLKEEEAASDLQLAVASGNLTEARAAEILALREQVSQQLEALIQQEALAKAEEASAMAKAEAAQEQVEAIDEEIEATWDRISAVMQSMTAEEAEAAVTELDTLETMRNEAADLAQAAAEEARAAATNAATAAEARQTLATQADTASTAAGTAATGILTIAKEKLAAAIAKVNAMMAANQFAIIIGLAIALGYAIYKLCTYESDAEKTTREMNESIARQKGLMAEEDKKLREVVKSFQDVKKGTQEWKDMKETLISQYGSYLDNLDQEIEKCRTLTDVYNMLSKAIQNQIAAKGLKDFYDEHDKSAEIEGKLVDNLKRLREDSGLSDNLIDRITPLLRDFTHNAEAGDDLWQYLEQNLPSAVNGDRGLADAVIAQLKHKDVAAIIEAGRDTRNFQKSLEEYRRNAGISEELAKEVLYGVKTTEAKDTSANLEKAYSDAAKKYRDASAKMEEMKKNRSAYTQNQWEDAQTELKAAKDEYEKLGGETKTKKRSGLTDAQLASREENAEGKLADVLRRQAQERLRIEQDYEMERWQTRINLMQEGAAKVEEQQALDFAKEKLALQRRLDAELEAELQRQMAVFDAEQNVLAAADKKYAKKVFRDSDIDEAPMKAIEARYAELESDLAKSQQKAFGERQKAAREAMDAYLREYGSYAQQREAIEAEYTRRISQSATQGGRMQEMAARNKALSDLDFAQWQDDGGMALAFGDLSRLSKQTVRSLITDMEQYRSRIIATFDPEKIRKFDEALSNLRIAEASDSFFGDNEIVSALRERLALQRQIADEESKEAELKRQMADIEHQLATFEIGSSLTLGIAPDGTEMKSAPVISEEDARRAEELRVRLDAVSRALEKSARGTAQLRSQLTAMGEVRFADVEAFSKNLLGAGKNAASLASVFSDDVADAIGSAVSQIDVMSEAFASLTKGIDALRQGVVKGVDTAVGGVEKLVDGASAGMTAASAAGAASLSALEKASAILTIISAAIQLATAVASLINTDKRHEREIERLQEQIDALVKSYDELGRAADRAFSADASALISQQNTLLEQQKALISQQMSEEEAKKKTDDDKVKDYLDRIDEIDQAIADNRDAAREALVGEDVMSAIGDFASALTEAWTAGTDAAEATKGVMKNLLSSALSEDLKKSIQPAATAFYDALAEAMADGVLTDAELARLDTLKEDMDAAAAARQEQYEMIERRYKDLDELREELTSISFDSVRDNFRSLLSDMSSTAEDFTDGFADMLRDALINGLMDAKYDAMLKEWYEGFATAMADHTLTDTERDELRQQYQAIVDQGIADRNAINDIVGSGAYSQSASSGSAWNISQQTGDELNGRFTAMVELEASGNLLLSDGNAIARDILSTIRSMAALPMTAQRADGDDTLLSIRDMMFLSTGYLEDIAKYSRLLTSISSDLSDMKAKIRDL